MSEAEKLQLLERVSQMDSREQERLGWFVAGMNAQSAVQRSASSPREESESKTSQPDQDERK